MFRTFYKRCHETTLGLFWKLGSLLSSRLKLKHSWLVILVVMVYFTEFLNYVFFSCQNGKWLLPRFPRRVSKFCFLPCHLYKHTCIPILYAHPALNSGILLYLFTFFSCPPSNTYVGYNSLVCCHLDLSTVGFPKVKIQKSLVEISL